MADKKSEFDPQERIAGFSLVGIKRALGWVGIMDDRDDIKYVAEALHCPPSQAARVLDELEKRGFVTKAGKKNQWKNTDKGWRLAHAWHPPRRLLPAIECASTGTNLILESVPCSILRSTEDEADVFEEARVSVGVHVEYESDRLIEIDVEQPNDYDEPEGGALIDRTLYVTTSDAKKLIAGLQEAIKEADAETARRVIQKARGEKREEARRLKAEQREREERRKKPKALLTSKARKEDPKPRLEPSTVAGKAAAPQERVATEPSDGRRPEAIAAALNELRATNRARLKGQNGSAPKRG